MHLADFSYTERLLQNSTFFVLFLVHLGLQTQFKDIRRRVKNVKTAVFGLTMMSFLGWIIMDIMTMYLKYLEWRDPTRNCMPRRQSQYTQSHYDMTRGMKYYFQRRLDAVVLSALLAASLHSEVLAAGFDPRPRSRAARPQLCAQPP